jgi:type I restriction enzyme S subunit
MSFIAYCNYKTTHTPEFNKIPDSWGFKALKHIVAIPITDGPHETPEFLDEGVLFISAEAVSKGEINFSKARFIARDEHRRYSRKYSPKRGDIFMVKSGATTGVVAIVETDRDFSIWSPLAAIRCETIANPRFIFHAMRSRNFQESVTLNWSFGTQQNIGMAVLENLGIPFPPLAEQTQIARFLDHETAKIDTLIHEQKRLIELLKEKRQAVISHAVTKGLDPDVPMKDSGVEWLGEVPAHWVTGKLRWYATNQGGIAKGKDYANQATVTLPYLRVANVQAGYVNLNEVKEISVLEDEVKRYSLKPGDVLMNEGGDNDKLGRGTVWQGQISPCLHQNHVFAIRTNQNLLPEWLATFTQSQRARAYFFLNSKQSTNLASISSSNVMNCDVPIPPREEQQKTLQLIAAKSAQVNQLIDEAAKTVGLLGERRSALISAAVTGKIDVRNWQPPADESAFDEAEKQAGMETTA